MRRDFVTPGTLDANTVINRAVVRGVVGVSLILAAGSIALAAHKLPTPEWIGNAVLSITSGLIGYLARDPKQTPATQTAAPPPAPKEDEAE